MFFKTSEEHFILRGTLFYKINGLFIISIRISLPVIGAERRGWKTCSIV